jgi:C4-dicarboxylate transporter DctM subunit
MSDATIGLLCIGAALLIIQTGIHIAVGLMLLSFVGVWSIKGFAIAGKLLASSALSSVASYVLGVIPLFVLMGLLVSAAGIGRDTFDVASRFLGRIRGGLGMSTVAANAVFAACTGTSIASASVFTQVAVPEMIRHNHTPRFAVGVVAGSSVLGMLIPPSLLLIIFGIVANTSIGDLFIAGIVPGLLLAAAFAVLIMVMSFTHRSFVYRDVEASPGDAGQTDTAEPLWRTFVRLGPVVALAGAVLGGIYGGAFTPTEAGGVGALVALIIGVIKRQLPLRRFWGVMLETGRVTAAIMFLLIAAQMYSQMLSISGLPSDVGDWLNESQFAFATILVGYLVVLVLLGTFLDSLSIILIVVPFVLPAIAHLNVNLVWFGIVTVIAVEIGLLTPPLGIACFVIQANLDRRDISVGDIFAGAFPFTLTMLVVLALIAAVPWLTLVLL